MPKMPQPVDDYQAQDDHSTLTRAQEIQTQPRRMAAVRTFHKKKTRAMAGVGKLLSGGKPPMGGRQPRAQGDQGSRRGRRQTRRRDHRQDQGQGQADVLEGHVRETLMPLTAEGSKVMASMEKTYKDPKKAKSVFYASINKGKPGSAKWHGKSASAKR